MGAVWRGWNDDGAEHHYDCGEMRWTRDKEGTWVGVGRNACWGFSVIVLAVRSKTR
jgi:hypothetical protein